MTSFMLDIFRRNPKLWEAYRDEANLMLYGTADLERMKIAIKQHRHHSRSWTFNGTQWYGVEAISTSLTK